MGIVSRFRRLLYGYAQIPTSSTRNTRIERIWVEVGRQFARRWKAFFLRLETRYHLNIADPHHLWLISILFLEDINKDYSLFVDEWNHHGLRTTKEQTPSVSVDNDKIK